MSQTDNAISAIKLMIESGTLKPGDRLPPERELGEQLGVSRNSLREAVKSLATIRVLDVRRGDGTYVTSLDPALLLEGIAFLVDLHDDKTLLEMFAVRRTLEASSARAAAGADRALLKSALDELLEIASTDPSVEDLVTHDLEFHRAIAAATNNRYLSGIIETLSGSTVRARVWRGLSEENAVRRTLDEHRGIADALFDGDADLAAALMTAHVAGIESWLKAAAGRGETDRERHAE